MIPIFPSVNNDYGELFGNSLYGGIKMPDNSATRAGNIKKFDIQSHKKGNGKVSLDAGIVELKYFESVLSNTISASVTIADAGLNDGKGAIDTLPIRGGEESIVGYGGCTSISNQLSFTQDKVSISTEFVV